MKARRRKRGDDWRKTGIANPLLYRHHNRDDIKRERQGYVHKGKVALTRDLALRMKDILWGVDFGVRVVYS